MKKRIEDNNVNDDDDDDDDDEEGTLLSKFTRVPSMYDESVDVIGADDVQSPPGSAEVESITKQAREKSYQANIEKAKTNKWDKNSAVASQLSDNSANSDEDEEDDDDDVRAPIIQGAYDPSDYDQLAVSEEIKDIFGYITKYTPQSIDLENKLCPFLPEFIPAVGDIDAFIKVPRPDGKKNGLGLTVLDEPCTQQSDSAVLQLQLRVVAKQSSAKAVVKKIQNAEKNAKSIERWVKAISDLHSTKPSPTVQYTKPMPNIDNLMQEWPAEVEEKLNATPIPSPYVDCDLSTYVTIICNLFDIPVYESKIQSLHTFFSLYSTIKTTQQKLIPTEKNT